MIQKQNDGLSLINPHTLPPRSKNGIGSVPTEPGLGVDVDVKSLGSPLFVSK